MRKKLAASLVAAFALTLSFDVNVVFAYPSLPTHTNCGTGNCWTFHAYTYSTCGACTTTGTGWTSTVPQQYSVTKDSYNQDVMDEGVWLINTNNGSQSTEAGYVSGWWPYSSPPLWIGGINPYGTENNDPNAASEQHGSTSLTLGANVAAWAYGSGTTAQIDQNTSLFWSYSSFNSIPLNRFNLAQSEVHETGCYSNGNNCTNSPWMGNGSGQTFNLEYQASGGGWNSWGNTNGQGMYSPYWAHFNTTYYSNGGY